MTEIDDAGTAEVLWASSEQGKAAVRAAWEKFRQLRESAGPYPSDMAFIGAIVYAAYLAAGWEAEPESAGAPGHVHDWQVRSRQNRASANPTGGPSINLEVTVVLMSCAVCGDIKTETLRGWWDVRYLPVEWPGNRT